MTLHADGRGGRKKRRWIDSARLALLLIGLLLFPAPMSAQEKGGETTKKKFRQAASMREWVYKELGQAQEKAQAGEFSEALALLDKLTSKKLNSYERSQGWNLYAFIHYSQNQYPKAIEAYKKLLDEEAVIQPVKTSTIYSLSQLYFATEQWRPAIERLNEWLELTSDAKPRQYELLAQAHYQLEEYREALVPLKKAISLRQAAGEQISEKNYLFLRAIYFELDEIDEVIGVLEDLILHYPNESYWMQLAGIYGQKGEDDKRLAMLELAYLQGFLDTESEVLALVGLMLSSDLPYRAGKVLEKGLADGVISPTMKHWRLLSEAWLLAREDQKAIPTLIKAAGLSEDGELDVLLAQSYMNIGEWEKAAEAARKGIEKGGLNREDQAYTMLGQALFHQKAYAESRNAFEQAGRDDRSRQLASQWLQYVESEVSRQAEVEAALGTE